MMHRIDLGGEWTLRPADCADSSESDLKATVPGSVHTDLLAAGKLEDPYYRDRERDAQWVSRKDWLYRRELHVSADLLERDVVRLQCDGLDTLARIYVNGRLVGRADNMFRTWCFDVRDALRPGTNEIVVRFDSPLPYIRRRSRTRKLPQWIGAVQQPGGNWLRKEPCNFGWDWGPTLVTCGIWREIAIVAFDRASLEDVQVTQTHQRGRVTLGVKVHAEIVRRGKAAAAVTILFEGKCVGEARKDLRGGKASIELTIARPELWWPNGMGDQPLYEIVVDLIDEEDGLLDTWTRRIGLRTLRLEQRNDSWGRSFQFVVNGVAFFAKGANWIPSEVFPADASFERYAELLAGAADANMNMLRVWGGGIYEDDCFYELCDELGLCVWQDFMFACATYPTFDEDYLANVRAEAEDNVRRLRHHPCIALWCGNNELEMGLVGDDWNEHRMSWGDYAKLFDQLLPDVVKRLDPLRDYWPSSPHSPAGPREDHASDRSGDAHLWNVWHGRAPFEWYRTCDHRFVSEFGFQSFPEPRTTNAFTAPADRNVTSPVMEHHQRSPIGNAAIIQYMLDWFRLPEGFDNLLRVSQILHGMAMKYAVEHWRRAMPRCMGALYWQLNDCWPVASWAGIDYPGRWKALHYMARDFFAPVLVSAVEDVDRGRIDLHVTSDLAKTLAAQIQWTLCTVDGRTVASDHEIVQVAPRKSRRAIRLELAEPLAAHGADQLMLFVELSVRGRIISTNFASFVRPKRFELTDPGITTKVAPMTSQAANGAWTVTLAAKKPALWTWLELTDCDAQLSGNYFHLRPGETVEVTLRPEAKLTKTKLQKQLVVRSLVDTYRAGG